MSILTRFQPTISGQVSIDACPAKPTLKQTPKADPLPVSMMTWNQLISYLKYGPTGKRKKMQMPASSQDAL